MRRSRFRFVVRLTRSTGCRTSTGSAGQILMVQVDPVSAVLSQILKSAAGSGSLEGIFSQGPTTASVETLQRLATWIDKPDPQALLNQLALASSALAMARSLGWAYDGATPQQRIHLASLLVTEAMSVSHLASRGSA